jgi:hypothetical protein
MFESDNGQWEFIFRSYADLAADVEQWCHYLPDASCVWGMPRSGLMVASLIALYKNIPLIGVDKPFASREKQIHADEKHPVLVVEDSCWTGASIEYIKQHVNSRGEGIPVKYACYMCHEDKCNLWDEICICTGRLNHLMEWATLHIPFNKYTLTDMDGILCEDWQPPGEEGLYANDYAKHITDARQYLSPSYPLLGIVTSRLEKWRYGTSKWLDERGIQYDKLYMADFPNSDARGAGDGFAGHKAQVYSSLPDAHLFIESDSKQAQAIAFRTSKPVLDWSRKKLLHYGHDAQMVKVS